MFIKRLYPKIRQLKLLAPLAKKEKADIISIFDNNIFKIRVSHGCCFQCSYCAIRFAIGKLRSRPLEEIINEFKEGLKNGHKKILPVCGDLGSYGIDIGLSIYDLLKGIFQYPGDYKVLLNDFNIYWLLKDFDRLKYLLKSNQDKIDWILLPIQSGSDKILKQMNRGQYPVELMKKNLTELRKEIPSLELKTHILVGFPGETSKDFQESLNLIKEIKFNEVCFFKYADLPNTISSCMPDKVSEIIKQIRFVYGVWFCSIWCRPYIKKASGTR